MATKRPGPDLGPEAEGSAGAIEIRLPLLGASCLASTRLVLERVLAELPGVTEPYVNPATEPAYLTVDPRRFEAAPVVEALGRFGLRTLI